jgi:nitrate reductase NapAB chaperone NapD
MVTDLADNTGTATIHFSVVPPVVKYPITIVTNAPANGTVTTTPAEQAAAGAPVTINATPADGYAVGTITVTAADTSNVPVAGNTFTMPAQGVTLNVTFVEYTAPDMLITFENKTLPGTYAPNTALLEDGKVWSTDRVANGGLLNDKVIGIYSARLYPATGSNAVLQLTEAYPDSISRISYWVASYGSDNMANVTLTVEVSTNGLEWTSVETLAGAADITGTMTERVIETIPENAVYLRFVATAQATSNKRINIDNIAISLGQVVGKPVVVIDGNLSGTVNSQMSLEITLQNAIAADWWFDLKDPDNQPDNSYAWDAGTGVFSFTPSKVGNYTLTATAVDASDIPIANKSVTLTILAAGADVPVPPIVIVPGVGFSFDLPNGYGLARVLGADTVVAGNGFTWTLLSAPTDYEVEGTTVTIKTDPAQRRLFRIFWQQ